MQRTRTRSPVPHHRSHPNRFVIAIVFATSAAGWVHAASITLIEENDVPFTRDEHYTQGFKLGFADRVPADAAVVRAVDRMMAPLFGAADRRTWELAIGQQAFTPENLRRTIPAANDRPYGGWLYAGATYMRDHGGRALDVVELEAGRTGPDSLARQGQYLAHRILGQVRSAGWDYELAARTGVIASIERKWRTGWTLAGGRQVDLIPEAGLTFGNLLAYASAGALVRLSEQERCDYGPQQIRPAYSGTAFDCHEPGARSRGWTLFAGAQARYVERNYFLEGPLRTGDNEIRARRRVGDLFVGGEYPLVDGWRAGLTLTTRTREFEGQRRSDRFGSLALRYDW